MGIVVERTSAAAYSGGTSVTTNFTGTPTVGNRIIGSTGWFSSSSENPTYTIADNASGGSNTYATDKRQPSQPYAEAVVQSAVFSALVERTLSNLGVTVSGVYGYISAIAIEVSGLAASPVDVAAGSNTSTDKPHRVTTGALAQANELIYCAWTINGTGSTITYSQSWSLGSPNELYAAYYAANGCEDAGAAYLIVSSTTTRDVGVTHDQTSNLFDDRNTVVVVTYKEASSSVPPHIRPYSPDAAGMRTILRM